MEYIRELLKFFPNSILFIATVLFILPSCKKDKNSNDVEIPEAAGGNVKLYMVDYLPGNQTINVITLKNQASGSAGAVHVKLKIDTAVSAAGAKLIPTNGYTPPGLEYDVPANGTVSVPLTTNIFLLTNTKK